LGGGKDETGKLKAEGKPRRARRTRREGFACGWLAVWVGGILTPDFRILTPVPYPPPRRFLLVQVFGGHALLGAGCEHAGLRNNRIPVFVKTVSVAVRATVDPFCDDRIAPRTNLILKRHRHDFQSLARSFVEKKLFHRHPFFPRQLQSSILRIGTSARARNPSSIRISGERSRKQSRSFWSVFFFM